MHMTRYHINTNVVATGQRDGMTTLESSLSDLVAAGLVDYDEAVLHSLYPSEIVPPAPAVIPATA